MFQNDYWGSHKVRKTTKQQKSYQNASSYDTTTQKASSPQCQKEMQRHDFGDHVTIILLLLLQACGLYNQVEDQRTLEHAFLVLALKSLVLNLSHNVYRMRKFWRENILANLANYKRFAKIFLSKIFYLLCSIYLLSL